MRSSIDKKKASLEAIVKTTVKNFVQEYSLDIELTIREVNSLLNQQIKETFHKAQSFLKGDGVTFKKSMKKLATMVKVTPKVSNSPKKKARKRRCKRYSKKDTRMHCWLCRSFTPNQPCKS